MKVMHTIQVTEIKTHTLNGDEMPEKHHYAVLQLSCGHVVRRGGAAGGGRSAALKAVAKTRIKCDKCEQIKRQKAG